jgi:hypothetical protein
MSNAVSAIEDTSFLKIFIYINLFLHVRSILIFFFFLLSWGAMKPSPLGTSANWPIVPVSDDI